MEILEIASIHSISTNFINPKHQRQIGKNHKLNDINLRCSIESFFGGGVKKYRRYSNIKKEILFLEVGEQL